VEFHKKEKKPNNLEAFSLKLPISLGAELRANLYYTGDIL